MKNKKILIIIVVVIICFCTTGCSISSTWEGIKGDIRNMIRNADFRY